MLQGSAMRYLNKVENLRLNQAAVGGKRPRGKKTRRKGGSNPLCNWRRRVGEFLYIVVFNLKIITLATPIIQRSAVGERGITFWSHLRQLALAYIPLNRRERSEGKGEGKLKSWAQSTEKAAVRQSETSQRNFHCSTQRLQGIVVWVRTFCLQRIVVFWLLRQIQNNFSFGAHSCSWWIKMHRFCDAGNSLGAENWVVNGGKEILIHFLQHGLSDRIVVLNSYPKFVSSIRQTD